MTKRKRESRRVSANSRVFQKAEREIKRIRDSLPQVEVPIVDAPVFIGDPALMATSMCTIQGAQVFIVRDDVVDPLSDRHAEFADFIITKSGALLKSRFTKFARHREDVARAETAEAKVHHQEREIERLRRNVKELEEIVDDKLKGIQRLEHEKEVLAASVEGFQSQVLEHREREACADALVRAMVRYYSASTVTP